MIACEKYTFENIEYGITTRENGADFTLRHLGDSFEKPSMPRSESWRELIKTLGFARVAMRKQVHGSDIEWIGAEASYNGNVADALITDTPGVLLAVTVADCCGVVLWSEQKPVVACIHSGWRGTQVNIVAKVVHELNEKGAVPPLTLHAWLSPCASGRSYVVRNDVRALFPKFCTQIGEDQFLFDNSAAIREQLIQAGVSGNNVETSPQCTIESDRYHSFRRDGIHSGRNAVFVGIRS